MELEGKCADDFYKWLAETHYNGRHDVWLHFAGCTDAMIFGVFLEFFDSKGYEVVIYKDDYTWEIDVNNEWYETNIKTRKEANEIAVKTLCKFYNFDSQDAK